MESRTPPTLHVVILYLLLTSSRLFTPSSTCSVCMVCVVCVCTASRVGTVHFKEPKIPESGEPDTEAGIIP